MITVGIVFSAIGVYCIWKTFKGMEAERFMNAQIFSYAIIGAVGLILGLCLIGICIF